MGANHSSAKSGNNKSTILNGEQITAVLSLGNNKSAIFNGGKSQQCYKSEKQ